MAMSANQLLSASAYGLQWPKCQRSSHKLAASGNGENKWRLWRNGLAAGWRLGVIWRISWRESSNNQLMARILFVRSQKCLFMAGIFWWYSVRLWYIFWCVPILMIQMIYIISLINVFPITFLIDIILPFIRADDMIRYPISSFIIFLTVILIVLIVLIFIVCCAMLTYCCRPVFLSMTWWRWLQYSLIPVWLHSVYSVGLSLMRVPTVD